MKRQERKLDHLEYSLKITERTVESGLSDIRLLHQSISGINPTDVDLSVEFLGKRLAAPLMINAITGGHPDTLRINRELAMAARKTGLAMAVGSQKAALENDAVKSTYTIAREENPDGILLANLSAGCTLEEAEKAVEMIKADGIQLHFNVPQELAMEEGDHDFGSIIPDLASLVERIKVPVIAKEVGFGISRETALILYKLGINIIDIGGRGGTNFISIENARKGCINSELEGWGIPTAVSLFECLDLRLPIKLIASGGLRTPLDIARSLAAGANMVAMAKPFLDILVNGSMKMLIDYIERLKHDLSVYMVMAGARDICGLSKAPLVISGQTAEWLIRRGVEINAYARR